jgi:hypothetical protein
VDFGTYSKVIYTGILPGETGWNPGFWIVDVLTEIRIEHLRMQAKDVTA